MLLHSPGAKLQCQELKLCDAVHNLQPKDSSRHTHSDIVRTGRLQHKARAAQLAYLHLVRSQVGKRLCKKMCHPLPCPDNIVWVGRSILLGEIPQRGFDGARGHDAEEMMKDPGLDLEARFVHGVCRQDLVNRLQHDHGGGPGESLEKQDRTRKVLAQVAQGPSLCVGSSSLMQTLQQHSADSHSSQVVHGRETCQNVQASLCRLDCEVKRATIPVMTAKISLTSCSQYF